MSDDPLDKVYLLRERAALRARVAVLEEALRSAIPLDKVYLLRECAALRARVAVLEEALRSAIPLMFCECPDDDITGITRHYGDECPVAAARALLAGKGE